MAVLRRLFLSNVRSSFLCRPQLCIRVLGNQEIRDVSLAYHKVTMLGNVIEIPWGDKVLQLLSRGAYTDATHYAKQNIPLSRNIQQGFVPSLYAALPKYQPERLEAIEQLKEILAAICIHCPVDDVVFDLVDASSDNQAVDVFEVTLLSFKTLFSRKRNDMFLDWCLSMIRVNISKICKAENTVLQDRCFNTLFCFLRELTEVFAPISANAKCLLVATALHFTDVKYPHCLQIEAYNLMGRLVPDPIYLLQPALVRLGLGKKPRANCHLINDEIVPKVAYGLYFHHVWHSATINRPQLYCPAFILLSSLPLTESLLNSQESKISLRGVQLLNSHLLCCQTTLDNTDLTQHVRSTLIKLNHLMVFADEKSTRELALKAFDSLITKFDTKAQYHLFLNYRGDVTHSGTFALIISKIKYLYDASDDVIGIEYFRGKRLFDLCKLYCFLTNGDRTDIVQNAEHIIAALNFFWYLLIRIGKSDVKIYELVPELQATFLQPLHTLVRSTLDNFKREITLIEQGEKLPDVNISVQLPLPELSKENKIKSIMCARNATELIDMNLQKIMELLSNM